MTEQLRLYTQNNFRRNLAGPIYPDKIVLRGRDLDFFTNISPLLETLKEGSDQENELILPNTFFRLLKWPLVVDLLFPYELPQRHMPSHELFLFRENGNPYLNPNRDVTMKELHKIIDFFMIGHPREADEVLMKFVYMRPGAPERPRDAKFTISSAQENRQERAYRQSIRNRPPANNYPVNNGLNWSNKNENNENGGVNLGYTEEEEEALGRLQGANVKRYFRGGKRLTRRGKMNKKTRKH